MTSTPAPASRRPSRIVSALALLFLTLAVGSVIYAFFFVGAELRLLEQAKPFRAGAVEPVQDQLVLLSGTISNRNPLLIRDLVVGCEEKQDTDGRHWDPVRQFNGPLIIDLETTEVTLTLRQPCPRGDHAVIPNPETTWLRWVGFRRGQRVTVVGKVDGVAPLSVRAEHYFGGGVDDYRRYLTRARWYVVPFAAVCLLFSALCWWGGRKSGPPLKPAAAAVR
jgi:hypothetical protein